MKIKYDVKQFHCIIPPCVARASNKSVNAKETEPGAKDTKTMFAYSSLESFKNERKKKNPYLTYRQNLSMKDISPACDFHLYFGEQMKVLWDPQY